MVVRSLALILLFPVAVHARIGETVEQCVDRYGPADGAYEQKDTKLFHKAGLDITVHYFEGKGVCVIYSKASQDALSRGGLFSDTEIQQLLKNKAGEFEWVAKGSGLMQKFWATSDGSVLASYRANESPSLVVLTKGCAAWKRADKEAADKENLKGL